MTEHSVKMVQFWFWLQEGVTPPGCIHSPTYARVTTTIYLTNSDVPQCIATRRLHWRSLVNMGNASYAVSFMVVVAWEPNMNGDCQKGIHPEHTCRTNLEVSSTLAGSSDQCAVISNSDAQFELDLATVTLMSLGCMYPPLTLSAGASSSSWTMFHSSLPAQ
jgi:hypothetical protein